MSILAVDGDGRRASLWCNPETGGLYVTADPYDVTAIPPWAVRATAFRTDHKGRLILADEAPTFEWLRNDLFGSGEQGIYMPTVHESFLRGDLYQDAAGTTPVTAVGQPVGLWLDRSKGLELGPELVANTEPNFRVFRDDTSSITFNPGVNLVAGRRYLLAVVVTNNVGTTQADFRVAGSGAGWEDVPKMVIPSGFNGTKVFRCVNSMSGLLSFSGSAPGTDLVVSSISIRELPGNHASQPTAASCPTLQQDANGMYVLRFDGVDDWMVTPSIDFTGTDKMKVLAGVRRVTDALMCFVELGPITDTNNGTFTLFHPSTAGAVLWSVRGTAMSNDQVSGAFPANTSCVYTGAADFAASGTSNAGTLRRNGSRIDQPNISTPGAVSFSDWPIYIGRRAGTSFPVNGDIYGLIVVGAQKTLAQIEQAENLINKYARAY